jgi:hypothetical protein
MRSPSRAVLQMAIIQVLTAASMKMAVFWDVAPCGLVEIDRSFRDASSRLHGATSQKTVIFSVTDLARSYRNIYLLRTVTKPMLNICRYVCLLK